MEEKRDSMAESVIESLSRAYPDMKKEDISVIFYLGATHGANTARAKVKTLMEAMWAGRAARAEKQQRGGR
ncbi:MAG: hypothetical protein ACE5DW_06820 [Thermodesulfobacteriota bacterium]